MIFMKIAPIINPDARKDTPKALRVDLRKAFSVGTIIWLVLSILTAIFTFLHICNLFTALICFMGFLVGIALLIWEHFDRWDYRRLGK